MATASQLKALRKKHHLGEFRRGSVKHTRIKSHRRFNMARRRTRRTSRRGNTGLANNLTGAALGVGGYVLYEALLESKVANTLGSGMVLNIAELATGVWLSKKSGIVGNVGKAAVVLSAYKIIKPLMSGITGSSY